MENNERLLEKEHSYSRKKKKRNAKKVEATKVKMEMKYREVEKNLNLERNASSQLQERELNNDYVQGLAMPTTHEMYQIVQEDILINENIDCDNDMVQKMYAIMLEGKDKEKDAGDTDGKEDEGEEDSNVDFEDSASEDSADEFDEDLPSYENSRWDNVLMFPQSNLVVNEVLEMLYGYFIQFSLGEKARLKLIEVIKILAGPTFKNLNVSNYIINKNIDPPEDKIIYHYYCNNCEKEILFSSVKSGIKKHKRTCTKCETSAEIGLTNPSYFLSLNFEYQLQLLMQNKDVSKYLWQKVTSNIEDRGNTSNITDIQSSGLYRRTAEKFPTTITYNLSTDGAPLSSSKVSPRSFWPLTVIINDLPPEIRFKYVILVGIMVVSKEPRPDLMNLFIDQFKEQARVLHEKGMKFKFKIDDIERTITFTLLCIIADSVARAVLQCRMQFNSYCSCSYCYIIGLFCKSVKFPFVGSCCALRTHDSHMNDVKLAEKEGKVVNGVKGRSSFCNFPNVDMVLSFSLDFMHNGVLGITEQMWDLMRSKLTKAQRADVDSLLTKIQPPHEVHRIPGKLCKTSLWKATHWKAYMLYYSIPVLREVLPTTLLPILEH
ncbi:uncharacterized protein LOC127291318 isoform X3 [Leptopilina boulardi]|nr:uncharacterized protein LOC127291318 isoform X3 [Leptopilina boulardi]